MASKKDTSSKTDKPVEVKGTSSVLTVLCIQSSALDVVVDALRRAIAAQPDFFQHAPVLVDLESAPQIDIEGLVAWLRDQTIVPIALRGATKDQNERGLAVGLGLLAASSTRAERSPAGKGRAAPPPPPTPSAHSPTPPPARAAHSPTPPPARAAHSPTPPPARAAHSPTPPPARPAAPSSSPASPARDSIGVTIRQAVRSGQVIQAAPGDLVALAPINFGAEVVADGHIHVYAPLRGRATAGARGRTDARIFCTCLEAELLCIADRHLSADEIPREFRGKPAQVYVEGDKLVVAKFM